MESPNRFVATVRRELLDHVIVLNERHLLQLIGSFVTHYNEDRTHLSICKDSPCGVRSSSVPAPAPTSSDSLELAGCTTATSGSERRRPFQPAVHPGRPRRRQYLRNVPVPLLPVGPSISCARRPSGRHRALLATTREMARHRCTIVLVWRRQASPALALEQMPCGAGGDHAAPVTGAYAGVAVGPASH